jgi:hypothetical protein
MIGINGREPIRPKLGYYYRTDSGEIMFILKRFEDPNFPFLAVDTKGGYHRYTEKGRYTKKFGNHPLHLRAEHRLSMKEIMFNMRGRGLD